MKLPQFWKSKTPSRPSVQRESKPADLRLLYLVCTFLGFGTLMIYSASAVIAFSESGNTFKYFFQQIIWVILGAIAMIIVSRIPLDWIARSSIVLMVTSIVLLVLVLVIGKTINGATRWFDIGSFSLQPSEFAKLGFSIYLAAWLSRKRPVVSNVQDAFRKHLYDDLLPFMLLLGTICSLVVLQPDLDTAAIIAITALAIYFVSGKDVLHTLGSLFIIGTTAVVAIIATIAASYRLERLNTYFQFWTKGIVEDRGSGFQMWNGLIAIGTGGIFGVGFGESRQKLFYLQNAAFTDSIFSVIAEEFGLIGALLVILGFLYFMSLGVEIARKAPNKFSALLAMGITTWIVIQALLNIGANLALIPFGGIPLPFLSYGGSNTITIMIGVGLLLNIKRNSKESRVLAQ